MLCKSGPVQVFFGRINYDYAGRYLVEGNLRYDGSSRFRRGNRWILNSFLLTRLE